MATENNLDCQSYPANTDLSASQYCAVDLNSSGNIALPSAGGPIIGVLQDKPAAAGRAGSVAVRGKTKALFAGSVNPGVPVTVDNTGKFVAASSGERAYGTCVDAGTNGTIGSVLLDTAGALVG